MYIKNKLIVDNLPIYTYIYIIFIAIFLLRFYKKKYYIVIN